MTQSVLFDVLPKPGHVDQYFSMAAHLKPIVEKNPGFLSVERFANLQKPNWYLSFSCWKNEESLAQWRCQPDHNGAQVCGRNQVFDDYRLRVSAKKQISELVELRSRELILLLIGQLDDIQAVACSSTLSQHQSKVYQGVINPQRGLSIYEFAPNVSIDDDFFCMKESESIETHWFGVVRDYGMFNRAEAPTQFA